MVQALSETSLKAAAAQPEGGDDELGMLQMMADRMASLMPDRSQVQRNNLPVLACVNSPFAG